jgi:tetratricopeptide (TPR) repeat protein
MALANYYLQSGNKEMCIKTLNEMERRIPKANVELDYRLAYNVATLYYSAGDLASFKELAADIEKEALQKIAEKPREVQGYYNPYVILKMTYENGGEYDKEIDLLKKMQGVTGPSAEISNEIARIQKLKDSISVRK